MLCCKTDAAGEIAPEGQSHLEGKLMGVKPFFFFFISVFRVLALMLDQVLYGFGCTQVFMEQSTLSAAATIT